MSILENIYGHQNLKELNAQQRIQLCQELRKYLIASVSKTGGHVASNLGVVELTVAIETVFDTQKDRLVFDVGHQSYIHKLLTNRRADFATLRQFGGIAGFPKPSESEADAFVAGHASSSVSIALGMARARTLQGENYNVLALIGDGAATGGMAYEGLNDAAVSGEPMIIILNDNEMSIDRNVGGMASHLRQLRTKERYLGMKAQYRNFLNKIPGGRFMFRITRNAKDRVRRMLIAPTIFESMGFTYLGPVDGHDTENLINLLQTAKELQRPVVLHVVTQKGRGYAPAQEHPKLFHGIGAFDPDTGNTLKKSTDTFSASFGRTMVELGKENTRVCAITAAMPGGTGLLDFKEQFPKRFFDVGIAEEHAVSMAGGLAKQGMIPVVALYSTFLQRAYDMILQDICMLNLHIVLAIDRAGLVGEDGETHHGVFDVGFLRHAPNMTILCPATLQEQADMLRWATLMHNGPVAIRYPRGGNTVDAPSAWNSSLLSPEYGALTCHRKGKDVTIICYGSMLKNAMEAADHLAAQGVEATVLRLLTVKPLPISGVLEQMAPDAPIVILEEVSENCGVRDSIAFALRKHRPQCEVTGLDLGGGYVPHGSMEKLYKHCGLSSQGISAFVQGVLAK